MVMARGFGNLPLLRYLGLQLDKDCALVVKIGNQGLLQVGGLFF